MTMVDTDNRYVYKGSATTPPCGQYVYWNVLSTIYPISQKHLDQFKTHLARADQRNLDTITNMSSEFSQHAVSPTRESQ
jgi:carbonic anhydrase